MSVSTQSILPQPIETYLERLSRRRDQLSLARAVGRAAAVVILATLICCLLDRLLHLPGSVRVFLLLSTVGAALGLLARPVWRHFAKPPVDWVTTSELAETLDDSFGQRLATVTSRLLGPSGVRGSRLMLDAVVGDAVALVSERDSTKLLPANLVYRPWGIAGAGLVLLFATLPFSWLAMPQLLARWIRPLADIAAVTSTRLHVTPGSTRVPQGEPLMIRVSAERLGDNVPRVSVSGDGGQTWSRHVMTPIDNDFIHRLEPVGRDLQYRVTGGDATSPTFDVQVIRQPLVTEFRTHYIYPAYTKRKPLTDSNATGLIEAPVGTEAVLTVTATEPIVSGELLLGGKPPVPMTRTLDLKSMQVKLAVDQDATYSLRLKSDRGAPNDSKAQYRIRALPDRAPIVRVLDSDGGARPGPRDVLPVTFQALDDYGVAELVINVRVNGGEPLKIPLKVRGDARLQEETFPLDLAPMNLKVGDVAGIVVTAKDGRGQAADSSPMVAFVSPRAIDINSHQRIIELEAARSLVERLAESWETAGKAVERASALSPREAAQMATANAEANRAVADAGEIAAVLRQSLLRATLRSKSNEMSVTLAALLDGVQQQMLSSQSLIGVRGGDEATERRNQLTETTNSARQIRDAVRTLSTSERAAAIDAERENVAAAQLRAKDPAYPEVLRRGVDRMTADLSDELRAIGIDPGAGDVANQLRARVEAAEGLMRSQSQPDFAKASGAWSKIVADPHSPTGFEGRLSTAAQAESIRPDADLLRARDLQVSAEAAGKIERNEAPPTSQPTDPLPNELYPASMLALQRYHETNRPMLARPSSDEIEQRKQMAEIGRSRMRTWAGLEIPAQQQAERVDATAMPVDSDTADTLAMQANAAATKKDYQSVAHIDRLLAKRPELQGRPASPNQELPADQASRAQQTMATAQRIDELAARQQALAEETKLAKPETAGDLAARQAGMQDAITQVQQTTRLDLRGPDDPDWRQDATAAIQKAQETLAVMPQALSSTGRAIGLHRTSLERLERARAAFAAASVDQQPPLGRAVEQAKRDADDAAGQVTAAATPIATGVAEQMSASLTPFLPLTRRSIDTIDQQVLPSLRAVAQSRDASDVAGFARASDQARKAIEAAQKALAAAQAELVEQNPLVAARWFAQAATKSLNERPPALEAAERQQRAASQALTKAWDQSIRQAANERMAGLSSLASVFNFFPAVADSSDSARGAATMERVMSLVPAARQWGFVRVQDAQATEAVRRQADPAGFEEPIRLYFEALSTQSKEKK